MEVLQLLLFVAVAAFIGGVVVGGRSSRKEKENLRAELSALRGECRRLSENREQDNQNQEQDKLRLFQLQYQYLNENERLQRLVEDIEQDVDKWRTKALQSQDTKERLQKAYQEAQAETLRLRVELNKCQMDLENIHQSTEKEMLDRTEKYKAELEAVREMAEEGTTRCYQAETALRDSEAKCRGMAVQIQDLQSALQKHRTNVSILLKSNLASMPWLAGMMADFLTYDLEVEAKKLDWGHSVQRQKKIASIRTIRAETQERIAKAKEAVYQLEYLRALFPGIDDVLDTNYQELALDGKIPDHDPVRDYLSREEWTRLSDVERDQLALDRYVASHQKNNWQIGRDYELSVAYEYSQQGYQVDTFGSYMGLEDLGRDLIAKKGASTLIIQCKYWSKSKTIHEKHIYQLYGTMIGYCVEKNIPPDHVAGVFVTNIQLSNMARKIADYLGLAYAERHPMADFPRIKCNIGRDEYGQTRIFHLPMDQQYDATKISGPGEFYAFTVQEAVDAGFRRAFKWHGNS